MLAIILAALNMVVYAQAASAQRAHSTNLQMAAATGYLGVGVQDLSPERVKALNLKEALGVEVTSVMENAPAAKAGIHVHDVILEVSGQKITSGRDFTETIGAKSPGVKVTLTVFRSGSTQTLSATLGSRPQEGLMIPAIPIGSGMPISPEDLQDLMAVDAPKVGFEGEPLTAQLAGFFGVAQGEGVLVRTVGEKTPAEKAGLKAGDVVTKVNGYPVANPREIAAIVRQTKKLIFTVIRNKKEMTLNVEIAWNLPNSLSDETPFN